MKKEYGLTETDTFRTMTIQETGGTKKTVEAISAAIRDMLPIAASARRETRPASELVLALQCGGSDGYSAITANPALGAASDLLVRHGGTSILSETPEIYGAEHLLTRRAATREIGEKLVSRIRWWEDYTAQERRRDEQQPLARQQGRRPDDDPREVARRGGERRPGDAARRLRIRRAGEARRASSSWTRRATTRSPRPARSPAARTSSASRPAAAPPSAAKPAPSIKLATNSDIYSKMEDDMDINCGDVLDGVSIEAKGEEIFSKVLERGVGRAHEVGGAGLWRRGVRAVADRGGDVASRVRSLIFTPARSGLAGTYMPRTIIFSVGIPIPHPDV